MHPSSGADPAQGNAHVPQSVPSFDIDQILTAVGETAYSWDLASDRMSWARNACSVLQIADESPPASGRAPQRG